MDETNYFITEVFEGKTIGRILFHRKVRKYCSGIFGQVLDVASGGNPSYAKYLPKHTTVVRGDVIRTTDQREALDFNRPFPYGDEMFDAVLFFNALYIAEDPEKTLSEMRRVLKKGGRLFVASPFINNEMPEPHDYRRFTHEGLQNLFRNMGFRHVTIERYGERFTACVLLLHPVYVFNFVRLIVFSFALLFDSLIPKRVKENHPAPIGYFCVVEKE